MLPALFSKLHLKPTLVTLAPRSKKNKRQKTWPKQAAIAFAFTAMALSGNTLAAPNANFAVTVNTGPSAPNDDTVYPGEATSLRITLSNNSLVETINNANFNVDLPSTGTGGLRVNGASSISGAGCTGNGETLTTTIGDEGIVLADLDVPVRIDGVPNSGECYLDIPIVPWSSDGASTSHSYRLDPDDVTSDDGENSSGGPQAITVLAAARPTWSKGFPTGNSSVVLGGASGTLRITVNNPDDNISLTNFSFTDVFPTSAAGIGGAIIEPTGTPATGTCISGSAGAAVLLTTGAAAQVAVTSSGSLPPNTSCSIDVEIAARHTGTGYSVQLQNSILASSFNSDEGLIPSSNANRNIRSRSPVSVTKAFADSPIATGDSSTFTVTLNNSATTALTVDSFSDDPISAAPYAGNLTVTNVANSCGGGASNIISGGEGFSVSGFDIPAFGSCAITVTFTGVTPASNDDPTSYDNVIQTGAVAILGEPNIYSQARTASVIVADRLRVLKSRSPNIVAPGNPVNYTVTVQNFDNAAITNVTVADVLQNGATLLTSAGFEPTLTPDPACGVLDLNGRVEGDDDLLFTIPTIAARTDVATPGACTISFWAMIDTTANSNTSNQIGACDVIINGAPADCNASPSQNVTSNHQSILSLAKTFDNANSVNRFEGTVVRLRLLASNFSDNPLTTVAFSDTLPIDGATQQLRIASPANISNSCGGTVTATPGNTSITLNGGSIAARNSGTNAPGTCELAVDVVGPAGSYTNTADITATHTNADGSTMPVSTSDTADLIYTEALTAAKSFSPTAVGSEGRSTARIRIGNLSTDLPITDIDITDDLPAGMLVANPANAYSTCNGPVVVTATSGASSVSLSGATLASESSCDLIFDVIATGSSDWTNTINPGQITANGGLFNRLPVSATLSFQAAQIPVISKAINPGVIAPGEFAILTINITNANQALTNLSLSDFFTVDGVSGSELNGMSISSPAQASTNCPGGIVSAAPGGTEVSLAGANLAANQTCEVSVRVTSSNVGTITNTIPMNAIVTDQGATNSTTFAESTLNTTISVGVVKEFIPKVVTAGERSRLNITVLNTLPQSLVDFGLTDNLPAGLTVPASPNPISDCGGSINITWPGDDSILVTGGNIGPAVNNSAASCSIEIDVVALNPGSYVNTIPADTLTVGPDPVSHPPTTDTLEVREPLIVNKAIAGFTLDLGSPVGFTTGTATRLPGVDAPLVIRLENTNDTALTQVSLVDTLPDGLVVSTTPAIATTCTDAVVSAPESAREITLTGATLGAAGQADSSCTITVNVLSNIPGIYVNTIPAGGVTTFEEVTNEDPTSAEIVVSEPGQVSKQFEPPVIPPNSTSLLTIVVNNDNETDMTLTADLVDNLPSTPDQMVIATPNNLSTSCPGGVGVIQAAAASTSVQLNNGAVVPPGGCEISLNVTASTPGEYLNSIGIGALQSNFGPNEEPTTAPLLVSTLGYISGKVFLDNHPVPDGIFELGSSTPISGNLIELRDGGTCSSPLLTTANTDALGNYLFSELPAGTYTVCQPTQPAETLNSITTEGIIVPFNSSTGVVGTASNPGSGTPTSQIISITLNDNGDADEVSGSPENNFSEVLPASISGWVYHDRSDDGIIDDGEEGIGSVTVELSGSDTGTTTTNPDGSYRFDNLYPGNYTVTELHPAGWEDRSDTAGSHGGNDSSDDVISNVTLVADDDAIEYNFGEGLPAVFAVALDNSCSNFAAYVDYSISTTEPFEGAAPTVDLTWVTEGGRVVAQLLDQPATGQLAWPGITFDEEGDVSAWPGWERAGDRWVSVDDDRLDTLTLRAENDPTTGDNEVTYPSPTGSCAAQPPGTFNVSQAPTLSPFMLALLSVMLVLSSLFMQRRTA